MWCNPLNIYYLTVEHPSDLSCIPGQKTACLVKMSDHGMHLQPTERETCALVLFDNNLDKIKKLCQFKVISGPLKPEVYRIGRIKLLLNNISSLTVYQKKTIC